MSAPLGAQAAAALPEAANRARPLGSIAGLKRRSRPRLQAAKVAANARTFPRPGTRSTTERVGAIAAALHRASGQVPDGTAAPHAQALIARPSGSSTGAPRRAAT